VTSGAGQASHARQRVGCVEGASALIAELSRGLAISVSAAEARDAVREAGGEEPLETLGAALARTGAVLTPRRMRLDEAVWLADAQLPIVAWSEASGEWVALLRHGFFRARVWRSSQPDDGYCAMSRRELCRLLGAPDASAMVEVGMVHAALPAAGIAAPAHDDGHHGHHGQHGSPVRRVFALMKPEVPELWTIVIFSAITGLLYLALPLAINAFISNLSFGTTSGPFVQGLAVISGVLLLCLAVAGALRGLQHVVAEVIQRRIFVRLGTELSHRLPRIDLEAIDGLHAPELVNRFLDVITVQKSASMLLLTGINLVLSGTIGLTVLAFYHPYLLAYSLVLIALLGLIMAVIGRGAVKTSVEESRRKYEMVNWLEEIARHPRVFKGPGGANLAAARADDLVRDYLASRRRHFRVLMRQISSLLGLEVLAATSLLALGGWLVLSQQLTIGQLVASEIILSAIVASISKLGKQFEAWYDAVAAVEKLGHLVDLKLERTGGESRTAAREGMRVEAKSLAYARLGRRPAFEGLSFAVQPGERVALLGSRGMGTSSILELVLGMRTPRQGEVQIDGLDVRKWDLEALRSQACVLRSTDLIAGTVAENVSLGSVAVTHADVQRAVEESGLAEALHNLPQGLATPLTTGGLPLTGRQRARLLAARAIASKPRLLLLDEILDGHEDTLDCLARVLFGAEREWTVIVATRDPRVAARCSRTVELVSHPREMAHA
jgi:ABC-type bacteriocin/lantibiotic exporter with double-glycine peptidase domain